MRYIEQDGNYFKEVEKDKWEKVPTRIEQDGKVFQFNEKSKGYDHIGSYDEYIAQTKSNIETPSSTQSPDDFPKALRIGVEKMATFGTRPTIAGVGGGLGSFVGSLQTGKSLKESYQAGKEGFSRARDEAILEQEEVSRKSPIGSTIGELVGGVLTSPLMPVRTLGQALKLGAATGVGQAVGEAKDSKQAMEAIGSNLALGGISYGVGKGIGKGYEKAKDYVATFFPEKLAAKIASTTTGIPEKDIITYAKNVDEINKLAKKFDGNIDLASDEAKVQINNAIEKTRQNLNKSIETILEKAPDEKFIPIDSIVKKLKKVKNQIDSDLEPELVSEIDQLITRVQTKAGPSFVQGQTENAISIKELNSIKMYLAKNAKNSFRVAGQIFPRDSNVARAARDAMFEAKNILDAIVPNIKPINQELSKLHILEQQMNKNILAVGKPAGALLSAGAKENLRGRNQLEALGKITGTNPLEQVEKVSALRSFANTKILPQGAQTGYSIGRIGVGAGIGAAIAESEGGNWGTGAAIGAAFTGPTALKALINAGNLTSKGIDKAVKTLDNPSVRNVIQRELQEKIGPKKTEEEIESIKRKLQFMK